MHCISRGKRVKPKSKYEMARAGYKQEKAEKERLRKVSFRHPQVVQGVATQHAGFETMSWICQTIIAY